MTDLDRRLAALFDAPPPPADQDFTARVVALAEHDLSFRRARRRALAQTMREGLALAAVLASFVLLARSTDGAGLSDAVPFGSPAMLGLALLLSWALVASRPPERAPGR